MGEPSEKTVKQLFALSGNSCAYPRCSFPIVEKTGTVTGEIYHIRASHPGGPRFDASQAEEERHALANLLLLCRHHHKLIDSEPDLYNVDALTEMKSNHESVAGRAESQQDGFYAKVLLNGFRRISVTNSSGNVAINSPGVMQAQTINVRPLRKKSPPASPIPGTIGADRDASRYVQHLINRYNEYASSDRTRKTRFSYGALSGNIEAIFGVQWRLLSLERANEVFEYVQGRIAKTRRARMNKGKGYPAFSAYEEFLAKYGH